jgi:hypothetical protein
MFMPPVCWAEMATDRNSLANQMDRLIVLADFAWRRSPMASAQLARNFFQIAEMQQTAALSQRAELRIMDDGSPG